VTEFARAYDHDAVLRFPLMPGAHETAWRYVFDWAITGEAVHCCPGDSVLEFGAGSSWASEFLNRLGYRTVALDMDPEILASAQGRMTLDQRLDPAQSSFVAGDGQHLPFADGAFEGVICLNALHHMPDYTAALSEIRRVLKPGSRAAFSEPGSLHADSPESRLAVEQFAVVEKSVILGEVFQIARQVGFEQMFVKPYVYPHLVELDYRNLRVYRFNLSLVPYTRPDQIARFLHRTRAIFVLTVPGDRPVTSARPGLLRAQLVLDELPTAVPPGSEITVRATVRNTGDTLWLSAPRKFGGFVTFGVKLCLSSGRLLLDTLGRTLIGHDVPPHGEITVQTSFWLPETLESGEYLLRFDMVDEQVAWFEQLGSRAVEHRFSVVGRGGHGSNRCGRAQC